MKQEHVTSAETIVVGDAGNDVRMAHSAGVEPVVVLTGHLNKQEAESMGVRYIIQNVTLLPEVLSLMANDA